MPILALVVDSHGDVVMGCLDRHRTSHCFVSDDPRVTEDVTGTWNSDRWGTDITDGAMIQWGSATLTNENGTWEAPWAGEFASPFGDILTRWWQGTGDYEGLTFYMWIAGSEVGRPDFELAGIIFPGDPLPPPIEQ